MRRTLRKSIWILLALLIVAALLYRYRHVVLLGGFSWHKLGAALAGANLPLLLWATVSIYISYAVRALRWVRFSRYMGKPTFWNNYTSTVMGFAAIFILGRAGEPVRPLLIARKDRLPIADSFGVYALERVFDIGATAVIAISALLAIPRRALGEGSHALLRDARVAGWTLLGFLFALVVFLVYFSFHGGRFLESRLSGFPAHRGWRGILIKLVRGFAQGLQAIRSPQDLLIALGYSVLHWVIVAYVYLWVLHSFPGQLARLDFRAALLVLAFTMVGSVMQIPAVGGGAQVATFLVLTVILGVQGEAAAAAAIVMWLVTFAAAAVGGVPLLVHEGWSIGELRSLAREEAAAENRGEHVSPLDAPKNSEEEHK
jgi:glycosyltransferase 2 family protein